MEKSQPPQKQPRRLHKYLPIMLVGLVIWALYPHFTAPI